jgi:ABC-type nickel/cobalt efflux system permease component RcnA
MNEFTQMLQQGNSSVWWFIPSAIALGALHGLEGMVYQSARREVKTFY